MKKLSFLLFIGALFFLTSCEEKGIYKTFDIQYSYEVTVPADAFISLPLDVFASEKESNAEAQFEINDTRKDLVEEVYLRNLWLEIESPNGEDFSFLQSAAFYVDTDELPEELIAEKNPVPENVYDELSFDVRTVNLASFIKADEFDIRANIVTDEERTRSTTIKGTALFEVRAKVL